MEVITANALTNPGQNFGEIYFRYIRPKEFGGTRAVNVQQLLKEKEVDTMLKQKCDMRLSSAEPVRESSI